jgi:hypothetical protein
VSHLKDGATVATSGTMRFDGRGTSLGFGRMIRTALLFGACALGLQGLGCESSVCSPSCQQGFVPAAATCSCVPAADAGTDVSSGG